MSVQPAHERARRLAELETAIALFLQTQLHPHETRAANLLHSAAVNLKLAHRHMLSDPEDAPASSPSEEGPS